MTSTLRPAVFLDRDGVLIHEVQYLADVSQVLLIPGAAAAVRRLNDSGLAVVVVTNQSGVARGYFPESRVGQVHQHLAELLMAKAGATIDRFDYSPYHPTEGVGAYRLDTDCRKPKPGMLHRSAARTDPAFRRWREAEGDGLVDYARHRALTEAHGHDWRRWPTPLRDPTGPGATTAVTEDAMRKGSMPMSSRR